MLLIIIKLYEIRKKNFLFNNFLYAIKNCFINNINIQIKQNKIILFQIDYNLLYLLF